MPPTYPTPPPPPPPYQLLASSLSLAPPSPTPTPSSLLLNFFFYSFAFCKDSGLPPPKVSTFLSILKEVVDYDVSTPCSPDYTMGKSHDLFVKLLMSHAVDRPPHSVLIFSRSDVSSILSFVTDQYYRMWRVYKTACSPHRVVKAFRQAQSGGVETPDALLGKNRGLEWAEESKIVQTFPEVVEEEEEVEEEEGVEGAEGQEGGEGGEGEEKKE